MDRERIEISAKDVAQISAKDLFPEGFDESEKVEVITVSDLVFEELEKELEVAEKAPEVSEEASPGARCNRRLTNKQVAHVPHERRKFKFAPVPAVEEFNEAEEIDVAAPAAESVSDESLSSENGHGAKKKKKANKFQTPMTFGSIDG